MPFGDDLIGSGLFFAEGNLFAEDSAGDGKDTVLPDIFPDTVLGVVVRSTAAKPIYYPWKTYGSSIRGHPLSTVPARYLLYNRSGSRRKENKPI